MSSGWSQKLKESSFDEGSTPSKHKVFLALDQTNKETPGGWVAWWVGGRDIVIMRNTRAYGWGH